jgi:DNA modification methylase
VNCCVTSPPYWGLRDYGVADQIGLESTPAEYVAQMVAVFREVRRVLRDDGTLWLNLGDSYAGSGRGGNPTAGTSTLSGSQVSQLASIVKRMRNDVSSSQRKSAITTNGTRGAGGLLKPKDLVGIPWMVAFALRADGWYLRQDIIWAKPNPMPESVTDRCTKSHEYIFLLSKSANYYFDADAIAEDTVYPIGSRKDVKKGFFQGKTAEQDQPAFRAIRDTRNKRSVWTVATQGYPESHFAVFPPALIEPCIAAGCPVGGVVLDPFGGSGTTGRAAEALGRNWLLIELNENYAKLCAARTRQIAMELTA